MKYLSEISVRLAPAVALLQQVVVTSSSLSFIRTDLWRTPKQELDGQQARRPPDCRHRCHYSASLYEAYVIPALELSRPVTEELEPGKGRGGVVPPVSQANNAIEEASESRSVPKRSPSEFRSAPSLSPFGCFEGPSLLPLRRHYMLHSRPSAVPTVVSARVYKFAPREKNLSDLPAVCAKI